MFLSDTVISRAIRRSFNEGHRCVYVVRRRGRFRFLLAEPRSRADHLVGRAIGDAWFPGIG